MLLVRTYILISIDSRLPVYERVNEYVTPACVTWIPSRGGESFLGEGGLLRAIFFFEENFRPTTKRSNPVYATFFPNFWKIFDFFTVFLLPIPI